MFLIGDALHDHVDHLLGVDARVPDYICYLFAAGCYLLECV